jgi:hypothetical protein
MKEGQGINEKRFHAIALTFKPRMACNLEESPTRDLMADHADIRLDQVRFWIAGLTSTKPDGKVGAVTIEMKVESREIIEPQKPAKPITFQHGVISIDAVSFQADGIKTQADCTPSRYGNNELLGYNKLGAPSSEEALQISFGPWSTWSFRMEASKTIDVSKITDIWVDLTFMNTDSEFRALD